MCSCRECVHICTCVRWVSTGQWSLGVHVLPMACAGLCQGRASCRCVCVCGGGCCTGACTCVHVQGACLRVHRWCWCVALDLCHALWCCAPCVHMCTFVCMCRAVWGCACCTLYVQGRAGQVHGVRVVLVCAAACVSGEPVWVRCPVRVPGGSPHVQSCMCSGMCVCARRQLTYACTDWGVGVPDTWVVHVRCLCPMCACL